MSIADRILLGIIVTALLITSIATCVLTVKVDRLEKRIECPTPSN